MLAIGFAFSAQAQSTNPNGTQNFVDQAGYKNSLNLDQAGAGTYFRGQQDGENNAIIANQSGKKLDGLITQDANTRNSSATLNQTGTNGELKAVIRQESVNNATANIEQVGQYSQGSITQRGYAAGGPNYANIRQNGSGNQATINQDGGYLGATIDQDGFSNSGLIDQKGNMESATLKQRGSVNTGEIIQKGGYNIADVTQNGDYNKATVRQTGGYNFSTVNQGGIANSVNITQH